VQTDAYLLACCRYIELNPVRERMVASAQDYRWSSARERLGMNRSGLLDWNPTYLSLGHSEDERLRGYKQFLREAISEDEWTLIREALQRGQLTGNKKFIDEIARVAGTRIERRARGRPRRFRIVAVCIPCGTARDSRATSAVPALNRNSTPSLCRAELIRLSRESRHVVGGRGD